jgi:FKBP-type peptidyl-prolyl cis-trans isomerase SlyD
MQIAANTVASFHYTLTNDAGEVLDSSQGRGPLAYLHGAGNIVPGLEQAMEGRIAGDAFKVDVAPEQGYGVHHAQLVQEVPRAAFQGVDAIETGMSFEARTPQGTHSVTVTKVTAETITVDGNHPLAGQTLHFDVQVTEVRAASQEELAHGHVHGPGGHHH